MMDHSLHRGTHEILDEVSAAILIALAAACGGNGDNAALSKSFTYGAPQAPSSAEPSAATRAQSNLSSTTPFSAQPDATKGAAIVAFADSLAAAAPGSSGIPGARAPSGSDINHAVRSGLDNLAACGTVVGSGFFTKGQLFFSAGRAALRTRRA